jgi:hypothetical protein
MYFDLVKPVNFANMNFSLFHPRAFEKVVADYLTNEFSTRINEDRGNAQEYIAPVGWQPLNKLPVVAVRLQVVPAEFLAIGGVRHYMFFPLGDQLMACVHFMAAQRGLGTMQERDKRVSRATMEELVTQIINSFELQLSPEALEHRNIALAGLDDTSLVTDFPPLKWGASSEAEDRKQLES